MGCRTAFRGHSGLTSRTSLGFDRVECAERPDRRARRPSDRALQLVDKRSSEFTDADEAVAIHLSDMTAAALERAELYRPYPARI